MRLSLWLLIFTLFSPPSEGTDLPNCSDIYQSQSAFVKDYDPATLGRKCQEWRRSSAPMIEFQDGSVEPNPFFMKRVATKDPTVAQDYEKLKKKSEASPAKKKSVLNLLDQIVKVYREKVIAGTSPELLSENQKFLLARLDKVRVKISNETDDQDCDVVMPEAFADPRTSEVRICERGMNFPLEAYIPVLAHEIAHLMDPCRADVYQFNTAVLGQLRKSDAPLRKCGIPPKLIPQFRNQIVAPVLADFDRGLAGMPATIETIFETPWMLKCALLKPLDHPTAKDFKGHPFAQMRQCSGEGNLGPELDTVGPKEKGIEAEEARAREVVAKQSVGFAPICGRKSLECFADHLGAEVTAAFLSQDKTRVRPDYKEETMAVYSYVSCVAGDLQLPQYPAANARAASFLQYPEMQRALGCQGMKGQVICPVDIGKARVKADDGKGVNQK
jgi:hypothetical protein